jgi:hypothetical protein
MGVPLCRCVEHAAAQRAVRNWYAGIEDVDATGSFERIEPRSWVRYNLMNTSLGTIWIQTSK